MKYLSILAWWLLLLLAMQVSALILDHAHYLFWGTAGIHFMKACYLAFASILVFRYLSFRSQKSYESMVEALNRISGRTAFLETPPQMTWVNPLLHTSLVVITSVDLTLSFVWSRPVFQISIGLDLLVWILILRYVVRTYWLKSLGKRERIKAILDDSRSKMKSEDGDLGNSEQKRPSSAPFLGFAALSLLAAIVLTSWRWHESALTYRVSDLKACMEKSMKFAAERFYQKGELGIELAQESCVQDNQGQIRFSLDLFEGEIYLRGSESVGYDFFGNGKPGDEGLVLDPSGRFRVAWIGLSTE